jgi:hypothetical protein
MAHDNCTICGFQLTEALHCPACDAAEAIIAAGGALPHYHELLAEQIGNLMMQRDWLAKPISLNNLFPRFA